MQSSLFVPLQLSLLLQLINEVRVSYTECPYPFIPLQYICAVLSLRKSTIVKAKVTQLKTHQMCPLIHHAIKVNLLICLISLFTQDVLFHKILNRQLCSKTNSKIEYKSQKATCNFCWDMNLLSICLCNILYKTILHNNAENNVKIMTNIYNFTAENALCASLIMKRNYDHLIFVQFYYTGGNAQQLKSLIHHYI